MLTAWPIENGEKNWRIYNGEFTMEQLTEETCYYSYGRLYGELL